MLGSERKIFSRNQVDRELSQRKMRDLPGFTDVPSSAFIPIVYLGVACTSGAFILYPTSVKRVGAVNSAILMLFQIIVSMILAYLFLREIPDQFVYFGAPLIFFSFYLIRKW
jgi:drug/metabolite transporter (DMT)-like permease